MKEHIDRHQRDSGRRIHRQLRVQNRERIPSDLDKILLPSNEKTQAELPFLWQLSYRLLEVQLDSHWSFREHAEFTETKAARRLAISTRVGNSAWELEGGILEIATHSLLESFMGYGLTVTGTRISRWEFDLLGAGTLPRAARRIAGTGSTARRETLRVLSDTR